MYRNRHHKHRGFSLVELLIVTAIMGIILVAAIPHLLTARNGTAETVVIREIQTIYQAQIQYLSQFGNYAATLSALGPPEDGVSGPAGANLILHDSNRRRIHGQR